jgi:hypothetical protein
LAEVFPLPSRPSGTGSTRILIRNTAPSGTKFIIFIRNKSLIIEKSYSGLLVRRRNGRQIAESA